MALHLITGYAGREHITSADQGAYNAATFGGGEFVLDRGRKFEHTVLSNNAISIADGEAMMQGRYIKMPSGTSESVTIDNGTQGNKRNDLICIRYSKDPSTSVESASLVVIKGTPTTGTPTDPEYTSGDITDGTDNVADFPLYRVSLDGININSVTSLFNIKTSMVEYMDNYQLKIASADTLGGIKKPILYSGLAINKDGELRASGRYLDYMRYSEPINIPIGWSFHDLTVTTSVNETIAGVAAYYTDVVMHVTGVTDRDFPFANDNIAVIGMNNTSAGTIYSTKSPNTYSLKVAVYNNTGKAINNAKIILCREFSLRFE